MIIEKFPNYDRIDEWQLLPKVCVRHPVRRTDSDNGVLEARSTDWWEAATISGSMTVLREGSQAQLQGPLTNLYDWISWAIKGAPQSYISARCLCLTEYSTARRPRNRTDWTSTPNTLLARVYNSVNYSFPNCYIKRANILSQGNREDWYLRLWKSWSFWEKGRIRTPVKYHSPE